MVAFFKKEEAVTVLGVDVMKMPHMPCQTMAKNKVTGEKLQYYTHYRNDGLHQDHAE